MAAFVNAVPLTCVKNVQQGMRSQKKFRMSVGQQVRTRTDLKKNKLGSSDLVVTEVCLGTMTWGLQNTEEEAHEQMDYAIKERGVNFMDSAEVYPIPTGAVGHVPGRTEEIMGTWFAKNPSLRKDVVVGTKVLGYVKDCDTIGNRTVPPTPGLQDARLDRKSILLACEGSLRRLQTDYIDLYQLHWPDRYARVFGPRVYDVKQERPDSVSFEEQLGAIKELLDAGKIRSWGLSNETPYGIAEFVHTADRMGLPRPASIQNEFNLFDRSFECYLAESCSPGNYNLGLLPWSILAGGALTGKYQGKLDKEGNPLDESVKESRLVLFNFFQGRFRDPKVWDTISAYEAIAKEAGMSVATMAQAFCKSRWFIPSSIIGATRMTQLEENIDAFGVELSDDILRKIDEVHAADKDITVTVF